MARKRKKGKQKNKHRNQPKNPSGNQNRQVSGSVAQSSSPSQGRHEKEAASARPSLAQRRARHALWCVQQVQRACQGRYKSYARALPATILMSGLGQALAMEKAGATKNNDQGDAHRLLYQHLQSWLCNVRLQGHDAPEGWPHTPYAEQSDVLAAIIENGEHAYLKAQAEALAYLEWLKKFAEALLEDDDGAEQDTGQQGEAA